MTVLMRASRGSLALFAWPACDHAALAIDPNKNSRRLIPCPHIINGRVADQSGVTEAAKYGPTLPLRLRVTCGRRPGKNFLTFVQHWSGAVTCPAC
jgi:hypothetical protein